MKIIKPPTRAPTRIFFIALVLVDIKVGKNQAAAKNEMKSYLFYICLCFKIISLQQRKDSYGMYR